MNENEKTTATEALSLAEAKAAWIKYYATLWKLDPSLLGEAYDRALSARRLSPRPFSSSVPDDYFDPTWKSC
jgi:hypothetical protein